MADIDYMKKGGKAKATKAKVRSKAKGGKAKATATLKGSAGAFTATNTVHVHVTKRQAAPRRTMAAAGGNLAAEKALGRVFQQLGNMSFHPPLYSSIPPVIAQSVPIVPPEKELPQQQSNIINLQDLASNPTLDDLYRGKFVREEWERQEAFSHASHLPASIDHGNFADRQSIPFSHMSYGDENDVEARAINTNGDGQMDGGFYGDYEDFATLPAEPMLKEAPVVPIEQPMTQSVNNIVPFKEGHVIRFPALPAQRSHLHRVPQNAEESQRFGRYGYGYAVPKKVGQAELVHRTRPPRADERSLFSDTESHEGRLYYVRPLQSGNQGGGKRISYEPNI